MILAAASGVAAAEKASMRILPFSSVVIWPVVGQP